MTRAIYDFTRLEWLERFPHGERKYQTLQHANAVAAAAGEGKYLRPAVLNYYKRGLRNHPQFRHAMEARGLDPDASTLIEVGCVKTVPGKSVNFYQHALDLLQEGMTLGAATNAANH